MRTYTVNGVSVVRGMRWTGSDKAPVIEIGGGVSYKKIYTFNKNPPELYDPEFLGDHDGCPSINDAHPLVYLRGPLLAKPNISAHIRILVLIRTRALVGEPITRGAWSFGGNFSTPQQVEQVLVTATGPHDYNYFPQNHPRNIGWRDALILMNPGDCITVTNQNAATLTARYPSFSEGLVKA